MQVGMQWQKQAIQVNYIYANILEGLQWPKVPCIYLASRVPKWRCPSSHLLLAKTQEWDLGPKRRPEMLEAELEASSTRQSRECWKNLRHQVFHQGELICFGQYPQSRLPKQAQIPVLVLSHTTRARLVPRREFFISCGRASFLPSWFSGANCGTPPPW